MPRRPCLAAGDLAYHVLNRRVGRLPLFEKPADYAAFEKILAEAHDQNQNRSLLLDAESLAPAALASARQRTLRNSAVDHGHAYATLACSTRHCRDWLSVSGPLQIISGADG